MSKHAWIVLTIMIMAVGLVVLSERVEAETVESQEIIISEENFGKAKSDFATDMYSIAEKADVNKDGKLSEEEINAVTKIMVQVLPEIDDIDSDTLEGKEYPVFTKDDFKFDFKGIEYFREVKEVAIYQAFGDELADNSQGEEIKGYDSVIVNFDNLYQLEKLEKLSLSEADVSEIDFSKFESLKKVSLHNLYNLETLKVQKGSAISNIWLDSCDKLKNINVAKKNTSLKTLTLKNLKKYKSFNFKSKSLKNLYIEDLPKIKNINFKVNPKLQRVDVTNISDLKKIDVSSLKKLKILNLIKLKNVNTVKFSKTQRLEDIYFENLPKVTELKCPLNKCTMLRLYRTGIKKVDFKKAKNLKYLHLVNNKIKSVDMSKSKNINSITFSSKHLKKLVLAKGNKLEWLEWTNAGLKKFDIKNFNYKSIFSLNLKGNKLKKINVKKSKNLQYLYVDKNVKVVK